ncbi:sugar ABC transporter permease [Schaalia sp. lx-260]|uniref:sugar ABC transporter permease n=1 Tax=Schaalia sp. lx-260 TaxID=2899082 RepID=UPI001E4111B3|nr:sugar ABC transporter permease [Schaalia sp. lx-260]MCD4550229.1 sugar ABC transporter permease [Schaalia sp. lx-260]
MHIFDFFLGRNRHTYLVANVLIVLVVIFEYATHGHMLSASNLHNLLAGNSYIFVLTIGMVLVVIIGQIDLSVGAVGAFVSMTMALGMAHGGIPFWLAIPASLVLGGCIGAFHAFFLAYFAVPSFVITLAGMLIFRGLLLWESQALSVPVPTQFQFLGSGTLPYFGRFLGVDIATCIFGLCVGLIFMCDQWRRQKNIARAGAQVRKSSFIFRCLLLFFCVSVCVWLFGRGPIGTAVPLSALVVFILAVIYHFLLQRTTFGRHVYAVGGNPVAAHLSGVNVQRIQFIVLTNMGVLAALAGILFTARATAAGPQDGALWELDAIAAVFIGGVAISGGTGSVIGGVLGALVMAVLNNGLLLLGVGSDRAQVIKGIVLVVAVLYSLLSRQQRNVSFAQKLMRSRAFMTQNFPH